MNLRTFHLAFRTALLAFCLPLAFGETADLAPVPISAAWAVKWREDLMFAEEKMPEVHIRIDHATPLPELKRALDRLGWRIASLSQQGAIVELARVVARIGDGHTRLTLPIDPASGLSGGEHRRTGAPSVPGTPFHHYPVRFYLYADGLTVDRIGADHPDLLGARVLRIGTMSAEEAMEAVKPTIARDNEMQVERSLPFHLVVPEILQACGVTAGLGPVTLDLRLPDGGSREVTLLPVPLGTEVAWAEPTVDPVPLYRRHPDRSYWFEYLEEEEILYFRYVSVQDDEDGESLAAFATRMFAFLEEHPVRRLVIDLRGNGGGNNWLNAPLERGVIRAEKVWRPGGIVVIPDRATFSAAMNFVSFLAGTTPAIFVGEAAGGRPNHYGDAEMLTLPETGLTIRLSTVYHQDSSAEDDREQIDPHVPVPVTAADALAGRDPLLETVLGWDPPGEPAGTWTGVATIRHYRTEITLQLVQGGDAWSGTFAAPGWVEESPIASAELRDDEIRFEVPLESSTLRLRARATGDRLLGMFDYHGQWYPFVAERRPPGPS
ncbi:MAG: hypothetical protein PVF68_01980 [Acidobacteriota bacterium]|jgi:hypothetical protein